MNRRFAERACAAAFALCGALLVAVGAGGPSWLDSAELIAAARELGGIHPPGHPAWLSIAAWADLLPIGPYSARVVWLSALAGAGCAWFVARLSLRVLGDLANSAVGAWWAFAAAFALTCSATMWLIGARAEVYTLALLTNLWALDAALRAGDEEPSPGAIAETAIAIALGLINHHYVTLFALPAVFIAGFPAFSRDRQRRGLHLAWAVGAAAFVGLAYMAPTFRALADTEMRWGDPTSPAGFWDGVSAAHFQVSVTGSAAPVGANLAILLGAILTGMGLWPGALGLIGLGVSGMRRGRVWWTLVAAFAGGLATKSLMAINTHNPDDYGYTALSAAVLAIGIAAFGGFLFATDGPLQSFSAKRRHRLSLFVLPWLLLMGVIQAATMASDPDINLANMRGPDVVDSSVRRALSPGALFVSNFVFTGFNEQAWRIAAGRRPDVSASHLSFRTGDTDGGHRFNAWLGERRPELRGVTRAARRLQRAPVGNVLALSERWDVYAEHDPDNRIPGDSLGFDGFVNRLYRSTERSIDRNPEVEERRRGRTWKRIMSLLTEHGPLDHQTREVLVLTHALHAAHALRKGWMAVAEAELSAAQTLAPSDQIVANLLRRARQLDDALVQKDARRFKLLVARYARMPFDVLATAGP